MNKFLGILLLVFSLFFTSQAFCAIVETQSKVIKATVYTNSAQITRQARVDLKEGTNEVIFTNVPENLNEATLTVAATGTARAKILDAKIKRIFLDRPQSEDVRRLEDQIRELEYKVTSLNNEQTVIEEERNFLRSIKLKADQQIPRDLVTSMPKAQELGSLYNLLKESWQDTYVHQLKISREIRETNEQLLRLRKELNQLRGGQRKEKRVISIELDVEKAGALSVSASYLMYQASWYPEYDARVNYENKKVNLACLGVVKQTSGEDWQNIDLKLSTAKPTVSARMPELPSWVLRPYPLESGRSITKKRSFAPALGGAFDKLSALDEKSEVLVEGETAEMLFAQTQEQLTSVTYNIARKVDIKADGTKHRLPVFAQDFSVQFEYSATPKLSSFAYLMAKVTNERENLLPAGVRVFLDDIYVGSSSIDAIGKGEEFDLYLGIDEGVQVKREKLKEEVQEVWIAGIKRKNKVIQTTYKTTIENYKDKKIKINLFDQVPVSQSDQIAVKILEMKPKPTEEDYEDRKGVMRWEFDIAPRKEKTVTYTYQIEHPRNMNIGF